jgi:putative peptide zinc metalloprotease protein
VITQDTVLRLHELTFRDSDDSDDVVVGRQALGDFVELPRIGADALRLLGEGSTVAAAEARIAREHNVALDVAELAEALVELGFAAAVDGETLPDPADGLPGSHLPKLRAEHVQWLFGRTANAVWLLVATAAVLTWWRVPGLFPAAADFYWTPYVGLAVLVGTAMFSVNLSVHELMHLAAARSRGAPARIGFSTRLHYLVVQTHVTAVWAVRRKHRYRVYLAGLRWDAFMLCLCALLIAYGRLPALADGLLGALALTVLMSMVMQLQVYVRNDLYYVLMELLRARNLYDDGLAYLRYLRRRGPDPLADLPTRERCGVRIYAVLMAAGCTVALVSFALFGLPILVSGVAGAFAGLGEGPARTVDSALIILIEGGLQVFFLVTFARKHRLWRRAQSVVMAARSRSASGTRSAS